MLVSKYGYHAAIPSDIYEHMPVLRSYATKCNSVTEMGVRGIVSLWAWLDAKVSTIVAYDLYDPPADELQYVEAYAQQQSIDFTFIKADVLTVTIDHTDLLFIDTLHNYEQLVQELQLHANKVNQYIIFHDTTLYGSRDEIGNGPGLRKAIDEFMYSTTDWDFEKILTNNNGLTILKRTGGREV